MRLDEAGPRRSALVPGLVLLAVLAPFFLFGGAAESWISARLGDPATVAWLAAAALALDIYLPVPSSLVSLAAGHHLGFWGGFLAIFAGMSLGSLLAYGSGQQIRLRPRGDPSNGPEMAGIGPPATRNALLLMSICRPIPVLSETSAILLGYWRIPFAAFAICSLFANGVVAATFAACGALAANAGSALIIVPMAMVLALPFLLLRVNADDGRWAGLGRVIRWRS